MVGKDKIKVDLSPHAKYRLEIRYPVLKSYSNDYLIAELNERHDSAVLSKRRYDGESGYRLLVSSLCGYFPMVNHLKINGAHFATSFLPCWMYCGMPGRQDSKTIDVEVEWFTLIGKNRPKENKKM